MSDDKIKTGNTHDIPECVIHPSVNDKDCEFCIAQMKQLTNLMESRRQSNNTKIKALGRQGINIDPNGFIGIRLGMLIQILIGDDTSRQRVAFEIDFQNNLSEALDRILSEARRASLLQGVPPQAPPGFIRK